MAANQYAVLLLAFLACVSCSRSAQSGQIAEEYHIAHESGRSYIYESNDTQSKDAVSIDAQVLGYSVRNGFILVKQVELNSYECTNPSGLEEIVTIGSSDTHYWIIDVKHREKMGPFDHSSFIEHSEKYLGVEVEIDEQFPSSFPASSSVLKEMTSCRAI